MPSRKSKHQKHNPCPNDDHVKFTLIVSSIGNIRDQSLCGDCWAVSASSSFSDRRCIQRAKQGQPIDPSEDNFFSAYDTAVCSDGAGGDDASVAHFFGNNLPENVFPIQVQRRLDGQGLALVHEHGRN
jgi:hypothetical protein